MPQLILDIPSMQCEQATMGVRKDSVYGLLIAVPANASGPGHPQAGVIPLREHIEQGESWKGLAYPMEFLLPEDTLGVSITAVLYQKDSGLLYARALELARCIPLPEPFPWQTIQAEVSEMAQRAEAPSWKALCMKVALHCLQFFQYDDFLGSRSLAIPVPLGDNNKVTRELNFYERGGTYRLTVIGSLW